MIVGLGVDVASIERMARGLARFGDSFWLRILTPAERVLLGERRDRAAALAGRWAAKEAASKALGAPRDVWWHHVEVLPDANNVPRASWHGPALLHVRRLGVTSSWVSITHDAGVAAAVVVLER